MFAYMEIENGRTGAMFRHIGERFLGQPVKVKTDPGGKAGQVTVDVSLHR